MLTVRAWWRAKAAEIYAAIPDFGGFLVKANSEGQPGPQDYDRTHADGANMLAEALAPHGGIVMWRAFVYSDDDARGPRQAGVQRVRAARRPFARNVIVQVKNGAARFPAARALPSRCSGPCRSTPLMMEFQITKEYLGFADPPRLSGRALGGGAGRRHLGAGRRFDRRAAWSTAACTVTPSPASPASPTSARDRNWSGSHLRPGELVRLRPSGLGPAAVVTLDRRGMAAA